MPLFDGLAVEKPSDNGLHSIKPNVQTGAPCKNRLAWVGREKRGLVLAQERFDGTGSNREFLQQRPCAFGGGGVKSWGFTEQAQAAIDRFEGPFDGCKRGPTRPVGEPCGWLSAIAFISGL